MNRINVNGNNLKERVHKARCAQMFSAVLEDNRPRGGTITVPGTDGKRYSVILRWVRTGQKPTLRAECMMESGIGTVPCKGNSVSVCYHVMAAVEKFAGLYDSEVSFCSSEDVARNLSNIGNGKRFRVLSRQSERVLWVVTRRRKEMKEEVAI